MTKLIKSQKNNLVVKAKMANRLEKRNSTRRQTKGFPTFMVDLGIIWGYLGVLLGIIWATYGRYMVDLGSKGDAQGMIWG